MILDQHILGRGDDHAITRPGSTTLQAVDLAQSLIGWQAFVEDCLSMEWRVHASTFLPKTHSPRQWTATLVKQLWLIEFDMGENRSHELHKNHLSNKIHEL